MYISLRLMYVSSISTDLCRRDERQNIFWNWINITLLSLLIHILLIHLYNSLGQNIADMFGMVQAGCRLQWEMFMQKCFS